MTKIVSRALALFIASALLVSGCGGKTPSGGTTPTAPPASPEAAPSSGAITGISRDIRLDPATVDDADSLLVSTYLYEGLVRLDEDGTPQPSLAMAWTISDDGLDYIFELRPNVVFHNGAPLNADAVLANFNRWFDPAGPLHGDAVYAGWERFFLGFIGDTDADGLPKSFYDGIEKVNDLTILVHLNRQEPKLLEYLAQPYFAIVDPTMLADLGNEYGTRADAVSGTGPYVVASWIEAGLSLAPNPNYWGQIPEGELNFIWR